MMQVIQFGGAPLEGGGMSEAVRNHDWASTALGPMHLWPTSLRIAVDMLLASKFPGCLVWGPEMVSIYNDAFVPILGIKPAPLGRSFDDIWREVWHEVGGYAFRAMSGEAVFIENLHLVTNRSGVDEPAYFTFCYSPIRDETGRVAGFLDTVFETTASVESEKQWRELALTFEHQVHAGTADRNRFWEMSSDAILMVGIEDLQVRAFNPTLGHILGWSEDTLGATLIDIVHPDDVGNVQDSVARLRAGESLFCGQTRLRHCDGHYRRFSWTVSLGDGAFTAVGRDITQERESQDAMEKAEEMLRHAQKMEAVGQLSGGLAHDFNNLLSGISGSLEMLERRVAQGRLEHIDKYILAAKDGARRAATLTHRLLAFARRQPLDPRPRDLNALVSGLEPLVQQMLGPDIDLQLQCDPEPWPVLVDTSQLENAVINLCLNARDAMGRNGRLKLSTGNERLSAGMHGADGLMEGDYCFVQVEDNGSGMSEEVLARAFDPFFTTKPMGQGTGLGLSMVYGFAQQSGGRASIQSAPGQGTRITVMLPRYQGSLPPQVIEQPLPKAQGLGKGERVLLIDDEPTLRMLIREALEEEGYEVNAAGDAQSGLALLDSLGAIDLLITDIGLPGGFSGRQVASAARARFPQLRTLFITGYTEAAITDGEPLEEGVGLLTKPFALETLIDKVTQMFQLELSPAGRDA
ncbi:hybrid sensor histidine kinase/response regulator [Pseudomonas fontis]|uniref:histidine kinase n=1 Tax=Pseudomonas fontis TaxID=2942633 RepID=A0ABT5P0Y1_9PSED|nr:PAS domain-containing sensor histidine kinase [Pseudomonas fontis]MDD0976985.1 ATP-binding protein [Pseudomonas fontis]MDD0994007.1 ATP-binding protein [Pseudomonas fontis]